VRLEHLQQVIGVSFKDPSLLEQALIHDSYVNENPGLANSSNERMEFLGDAVIGLIIARKLYLDFPDHPEGKLTHIRAALVKRETLASVAESIGLGEYLYLGKGEEASGGRKKVPNLGGALEAVIGAVYLDRGMREAAACVLRLMQAEYDRVMEEGISPDYKTQLQHYLQGKYQQIPVYSLVNMTGPDHDRWFTIEVKMGNEVLGQGAGKSKKAAESEAARDALSRLQP
jgi:ribonuclease-3